jgi:hypothetical protein
MPLTPEQLNAFAAIIGQAVSQHMAGNPKSGNSQVHEVVRTVKGKRRKIQTTLPQLLGELNDRIADLTDAVDEQCNLMDEAQNQERKKKRKKRNATVNVDG